MKITSNGNLAYWVDLFRQNKVTNDQWSLMTKAVRKHLIRSRKH